jgi:hypothetical protein
MKDVYLDHAHIQPFSKLFLTILAHYHFGQSSHQQWNKQGLQSFVGLVSSVEQ